MKEPNIVMLLITAVTALSGCIVWLAMYIKNLHKGNLKMVESATESHEKLKSSIDNLTHSINNNTKVTDDLHKMMLSSLVNVK